MGRGLAITLGAVLFLSLAFNVFAFGFFSGRMLAGFNGPPPRPAIAISDGRISAVERPTTSTTFPVTTTPPATTPATTVPPATTTPAATTTTVPPASGRLPAGCGRLDLCDAGRAVARRLGAHAAVVRRRR